ncbi:MAG: AsmA family protein [Rhodospirillaceae bacterium]
MKALKIAAAVVAVLAVGVVILLMTVNVDQYKGTIEAQAKAATGREVTIGDIDLSVGLAPAIVLTDVKVANAAWGSRPEMMILPRLEVHTQLIPLLFGTINLTEINAENPDILLEIDKQGRGNWQFDVARDGASTPLNVSDITVNGLKLGYRDGQGGSSADIAAKAVTVAISGALQEMNISSFETKDVTVAYKTTGAPLAFAVETLTLDREGKINLDGKVSGEALKVNGKIAPIATLIAMDKAFPAKVEVEGFGIKATSDVVVEIVNGRPLAKGTISIPEIDMSKFASAPATQADGRLFPADPLPWDMISGTDADLNITIAKLTTTTGLTVSNISVPVKAAAGRFNAAPISLAVAGGTIGGDVALNAGDRSVAIKAQGKGFSAEGLAKSFNKGDLMTQGPIDLNVNVRGAGTSVREIMASLDGSVIAGMGESRIRNDALNVPGAGAILQVLDLANPFANKDPYTVARCAVANFQIADGIAQTNQGVAMVTDKMSLTSSGTVDLRNERIDLNVRAQGASGIAGGLGQLAQAVRVTGSLSSPSVGLDQAGVVKGVAGLGSALANGGGQGLGGLGALFGLGPKTGSSATSAAPTGDLCARARAWRRS